MSPRRRTIEEHAEENTGKKYGKVEDKLDGNGEDCFVVWHGIVGGLCSSRN